MHGNLENTFYWNFTSVASFSLNPKFLMCMFDGEKENDRKGNEMMRLEENNEMIEKKNWIFFFFIVYNMHTKFNYSTKKIWTK